MSLRFPVSVGNTATYRLESNHFMRTYLFIDVFLLFCPGVGKTTLVQKAWEAISSSGVSIHGFCTEEVRESGRRVGFDVVTVNGQRGILSRIGCL